MSHRHGYYNLITELITNLITLSDAVGHLGTNAGREIFWRLYQITPYEPNQDYSHQTQKLGEPRVSSTLTFGTTQFRHNDSLKIYRLVLLVLDI